MELWKGLESAEKAEHIQIQKQLQLYGFQETISKNLISSYNIAKIIHSRFFVSRIQHLNSSSLQKTPDSIFQETGTGYSWFFKVPKWSNLISLILMVVTKLFPI